MTILTVFHEGKTVKSVESGESVATVHGCEKATADTTVVGEVTTSHEVTVENGVVTDAVLVFTADDLAKLRSEKAEEIKRYGLSLIQSRVPEIDTEWALALMKRLWPHLNTPDSDPDLAYARDVYVYMMDKLDQLSTATREQIEAYDPEEDTGWP